MGCGASASPAEGGAPAAADAEVKPLSAPDAFNAVDADGDGFISEEEVMELLKRDDLGMKLSNEQIAALIREADRNGDGKVSKMELMMKVSKVNSKTVEGGLGEAPPAEAPPAEKKPLSAPDAFNAVDADGDGFITEDEVTELLKRDDLGMKLSNEQIAALIREADRNGDGKVSKMELMMKVSKVNSKTVEGGLGEAPPAEAPPAEKKPLSAPDAFNAIDADGDGFITEDEVVELLKKDDMGMKLSNEQMAALIREADRNGDGKISKMELLSKVSKVNSKTVEGGLGE